VSSCCCAEGAGLEARNGSGETPLHATARSPLASATTLSLLLRIGANKEARNLNGFAPLHCAAQENNEDGISALLQAGANMHAVDSRGCTPLHVAAEWGRRRSLARLLAHGADCNAVSQVDRRTPLHMAAGGGFIECAEPLLNAGAEANARDVHGTTPLLCASYSSEFVTVLLRGGADPFLVPPRTAAAVDRARDSALLRLLLVGCARGGVFAPARLYDAALWRVVGRFALGGAEDCQW
jgi:ankyrin repeat protein